MAAGATAQSAPSLGDYARKARQNKPQANTASRHYDNDNLPTNEHLSIVGPESAAASATPGSAPSADAPKPAAAPAQDAAVAKTERAKDVLALQSKIKEQQAKIDGLNHELNLDQREYRLRAAAFYADAGSRLRNSAQWDKDDAQYKADMESKEKAISAAKEQLEELQEQARKAGMAFEKDEKSGGDQETK
jgi:hypothetical protein